MKTGKLRPKLDAKRETLVACTRLGMSRIPACKAAGVDYATMKRWMAADAPFCASIKEAEAQYERTALQAIHDAATVPDMQGKTQWQAGAWLLERRHPERWGKRETRDVNMRVGPSDWGKMTTEERRKAVADAEAQLAAAKAELERGG